MLLERKYNSNPPHKAIPKRFKFVKNTCYQEDLIVCFLISMHTLDFSNSPSLGHVSDHLSQKKQHLASTPSPGSDKLTNLHNKLPAHKSQWIQFLTLLNHSRYMRLSVQIYHNFNYPLLLPRINRGFVLLLCSCITCLVLRFRHHLTHQTRKVRFSCISFLYLHT